MDELNYSPRTNLEGWRTATALAYHVGSEDERAAHELVEGLTVDELRATVAALAVQSVGFAKVAMTAMGADGEQGDTAVVELLRTRMKNLAMTGELHS